jgi:hypothetical protein
VLDVGSRGLDAACTVQASCRSTDVVQICPELDLAHKTNRNLHPVHLALTPSDVVLTLSAGEYRMSGGELKAGCIRDATSAAISASEQLRALIQ